MKLVNKTRYDSAQLRAILVAVHTEEAKRRGRLKTWDCLTVTVGYSKRRRRGEELIHAGDTSGYAYYHGGKARVGLPPETCTTAALAAVWLHELQHLYGIRHSEMSPAVLWCREDNLEPWIASAWSAAETGILQERPEPVRVPLTTEEKAARLDLRREKKIATLAESITRWEQKKRRAERALAKLRKQHRYFEGKLAAKRV